MGPPTKGGLQTPTLRFQRLMRPKPHWPGPHTPGQSCLSGAQPGLVRAARWGARLSGLRGAWLVGATPSIQPASLWGRPQVSCPAPLPQPHPPPGCGQPIAPAPPWPWPSPGPLTLWILLPSGQQGVSAVSLLSHQGLQQRLRPGLQPRGKRGGSQAWGAGELTEGEGTNADGRRAWEDRNRHLAATGSREAQGPSGRPYLAQVLSIVLGLDSRQSRKAASLRKTCRGTMRVSPACCPWSPGLALRLPATYLPFQQEAGKVLIAVDAFGEIHLDGGQRPAHAVCGTELVSEAQEGLGGHRAGRHSQNTLARWHCTRPRSGQ